MADEKTKPAIRDLAVAAAGNIADSDQAAVLVVAQADGTMRVTPFGASIVTAIQALALGNVVLSKALNARAMPVDGVQPPADQAA